MSFWKVLSEKSVSKSLKTLSAILLLFFYLVGATQIELLHRFFYAHDTTFIHSVEQEKDLCHRTIYHIEKKDGCEHNSHLIRVEKCCPCNVLFHSDQIAFSDLSCEFIQSSLIVAEEFKSVQIAGIDNNLPSRAPPFI